MGNQTPKININDVIGKKIAIHCKSSGETIKLLQECREMKIKWAGINEYPSWWTNWENFYGVKTCYTLVNNSIMFGNIDSFRGEEYPIIEFEELLFQTKLKGRFH